MIPLLNTAWRQWPGYADLDYPNAGIDVGKAAIRMSRTRIIDCIGASDEDLAHLRLLLRTTAAQLKDTWSWGLEAKADLVIVDIGDLVGDAAHRRTLQRGVACAQIIEPGAAMPDGRFLRKPLRREDFVALLNSIGTKGIAPMAILSHDDDFFLVDLGEYDEEPGDLISVPDAPSPVREKGIAELDAFEAMFKRDPAADQPKFLLPERLDFGAAVEFTGDSTVRGQTRADNYGNQFLRDGTLAANIDPAYRRDDTAQALSDAEYPLREYLTGQLLGGPARIQLSDLPALILDPKQQEFLSAARLAELAPYCHLSLRMGDWEMLTSGAMQSVREQMDAHPYLNLHWLDRYLNSGGRLAPHLDPGGRYRLTKRLMGLVPEFHAAAKIGSVMLTARRPDEIARKSGIDLTEVYDVVNAYESVGYVEWTLRERGKH